LPDVMSFNKSPQSQHDKTRGNWGAVHAGLFLGYGKTLKKKAKKSSAFHHWG